MRTWERLFHASPASSATFVGGEAEFGLFAGDVDLQEDIDRAPRLGTLLIHLGQEAEGVDAVDEGDVGSDVLHLVGLQVSDEVPPDIFGQGFVFEAHFLHLALAEDALACPVGLQDGFIGMKLADGHQLHTLRQVGQDLPQIVCHAHPCTSGLSSGSAW